MTEFISRRLLALPPFGAIVGVKLAGFPVVKVCSVLMAEKVFTRVFDDHSTVHFEGEVPIQTAADRFLAGEG
jgi:hypothetical protein